MYTSKYLNKTTLSDTGKIPWAVGILSMYPPLAQSSCPLSIYEMPHAYSVFVQMKLLKTKLLRPHAIVRIFTVFAWTVMFTDWGWFSFVSDFPVMVGVSVYCQYCHTISWLIRNTVNRTIPSQHSNWTPNNTVLGFFTLLLRELSALYYLIIEWP